VTDLEETMKQGFKIIGFGIILLALTCGAWAQEQQGDAVDVAPGFKLGAKGEIVIGEVSGEVGHFDGSWTISEEHDAFEPAAKSGATTQPSSHVVSGVFTSAAGAFNLTEQMDANEDGVHFSAHMTSDKEVDTNELYLSFSLPVKSFGGKQVMVDDQPTLLPSDPSKQGAAQLIAKDDVKKIEIPMPTGTLTIAGNLSLLLQDDREWDNDRYSLRLNFSPASGQLKESKIEFQMTWKPTGK
jgi:hypothetical protein